MGLGNFDVLSSLLCSVVLISDVLADFGPSGFVALACACETILVLSYMNSSTSWYRPHFSDCYETDFMVIALSSL